MKKNRMDIFKTAFLLDNLIKTKVVFFKHTKQMNKVMKQGRKPLDITNVELLQTSKKMKINRLKLGTFLSLIFLLLLSCSSPLNEIEVNEFNLIRANFSVIKEVSSDGKIDDLIQLQIKDKNWKGFELKGAVITVDGTPMEYKNKFLTNAYYSNIEIVPNKEYVFLVTLANGKTTTSTITTPAINTNSIAYNKNITLGTDYPITWDKVGNLAKVRFFLDDNSSGQNPSYNLTKTIENDNGIFVVNGNETNKYPHATNCYFDIVYSGKEKLSTEFRSIFSTVETIYKAKDIRVIK